MAQHQSHILIRKRAFAMIVVAVVAFMQEAYIRDVSSYWIVCFLVLLILIRTFGPGKGQGDQPRDDPAEGDDLRLA